MSLYSKGVCFTSDAIASVSNAVHQFVKLLRSILDEARNRGLDVDGNAEGEPVAPEPERLPEAVALPAPAADVSPDALLELRPDLRLLELARDRLELDQRLARNDLQPRLDFELKAADDIGAIGPGGVSRDDAGKFLDQSVAIDVGDRPRVPRGGAGEGDRGSDLQGAAGTA